MGIISDHSGIGLFWSIWHDGGWFVPENIRFWLTIPCIMAVFLLALVGNFAILIGFMRGKKLSSMVNMTFAYFVLADIVILTYMTPFVVEQISLNSRNGRGAAYLCYLGDSWYFFFNMIYYAGLFFLYVFGAVVILMTVGCMGFSVLTFCCLRRGWKASIKYAVVSLLVSHAITICIVFGDWLRNDPANVAIQGDVRHDKCSPHYKVKLAWSSFLLGELGILMIFFAALSHVTVRFTKGNDDPDTAEERHADTKLALLSMAKLLICWGPLLLLELVVEVPEETKLNYTAMYAILKFSAVVLFYVGFALNPFVCGMVSPEWNQNLKRIATCGQDEGQVITPGYGYGFQQPSQPV